MGMKRKFVSRKDDSEEELDPMLLHEPETKRPARQDISGCFFLGPPKFQQYRKEKLFLTFQSRFFIFQLIKPLVGWLGHFLVSTE